MKNLASVGIIFIFCVCMSSVFSQDSKSSCLDQGCFNEGQCVNESCSCPEGWTGDVCQHCQGRFLLTNDSGSLSDGAYTWRHFSDCTWLIKHESVNDSALYLSLSGVVVSCQYDFLFIYDGDGEFSPLLATYSGFVSPAWTPTTDIVATSGTAFLHFDSGYSDIGLSSYKISYHYGPKMEPPSSDDGRYISLESRNWSSYSWQTMLGQGRASATAAVNGDFVYVFGGDIFGEDSNHVQMLRLNTTYYAFDSLLYDEGPGPRFGHSMISYHGLLLVFGGVIKEDYAITNEMWTYDISSSKWNQIQPVRHNTTDDQTVALEPPHLVGHSAHAVMRDGRDTMLVIFGYHPVWGYSNFVFEYDIANNSWSKVKPKGLIPYGGYGHASALDEVNNLVYVHGGAKYHEYYEYEMYVYNVEEQSWSSLREITLPRYLHTMVFLSDKLLVFGGRAHRATDLCHDVPFEMYDIETDTWKELDYLFGPTSRYGQAGVAFGNETMFVFGGYDGIMRDDLLVYKLGANEVICNDITELQGCADSSNCIWNNGTCENMDFPAEDEKEWVCDDFCSSLATCTSCLSTALKFCSCSYGPSYVQKCFYGFDNSSFTDVSDCDEAEYLAEYCSSFDGCDQCSVGGGCYWSRNKCIPGNETFECDATCSNFTSCFTCTLDSDCRWCATTATCTPKSTSIVYYPYGTCTDVRRDEECSDPCLQYTSCDECSDDASCGWCSIDNTTGTGTCMSGSYSAPLGNHSCTTNEWYFIDCPECQCNGHSTCEDDSDVCTDCTEHTTGDTCDSCDTGYYGYPDNGGNCSACVCNEHADDCSDYGDCYCRVRGMTGLNCQNCYSPYSGNPLNGTCFYPIMVQLRYYFNLASSATNENITQMNFDICPNYRTDLLLTVQSMTNDDGNVQRFDIDVKYNHTENGSAEYLYFSTYNQTSMKLFLRQSFFNFGKSPKTCLRIYLNFETPFYFNIALQQTYSHVGLLLGVFFSCFLILLIIALVVWKVNSVWHNYHRRQRRAIELKVMASRPLATVDFEFEKPVSLDDEDLHAISSESLAGNKSAVASVLLWVPYGSGGSPDGHGAYFAIGSALSGSPAKAITVQRNGGSVSTRSSSSTSTIGLDNPVLSLDYDIPNVRPYDLPNGEPYHLPNGRSNEVL